MLKFCKVTKGGISSAGISFSFSSILTHSNLLPPFWRRVNSLRIVHYSLVKTHSCIHHMLTNRRIFFYYSTHRHTPQIWSWYTEYSSSVVRRQQISCDIRNFTVCREEKGQNKYRIMFSAQKLCFVINLFNNETIILLNLAENPLIFSQRPRRLSIRQYFARFRRIIVNSAPSSQVYLISHCVPPSEKETKKVLHQASWKSPTPSEHRHSETKH